MIVDEKQVMAIAKLYEETKAWRGELILAGCRIEAKVVTYNDYEVMDIRDDHRKLGWYVYVKRDGSFWAHSYTSANEAIHRFKTPEEIMDFFSEKLRYG